MDEHCKNCPIRKGSKECLTCKYYQPSRNSKFRHCSKSRVLWWECFGQGTEMCKDCPYRIEYIPDRKSIKTIVRRRYRRMIK